MTLRRLNFHHLDPGSRNLIILGVAAIAIAILTSSISIIIYHNSGDIYLDRSRPGFLPEEDEVEENDSETESTYSFSDSGEITSEALDEYLNHLESIESTIEKYQDPFSPSALSDESLGLPTSE